MLACKLCECECVYEEKAFPASTFMCAHEEIYGLPENNGLVELVQERNFLLILVIFIIIHFLFFIAGWNWTNNLPSNTVQQSVVVVKKSPYSGEKLIYGNLCVCWSQLLGLKSLSLYLVMSSFETWWGDKGELRWRSIKWNTCSRDGFLIFIDYDLHK